MTRPLPAHYADPDLVALYDLEGRRGDEASFYLPPAFARRLRILEAGCGTGWFAHLLARQGHQVTGLDPAPNMLAAARAKPGAHSVTWIEGDMRAFSVPDRFDLIVLTGHAFQVLEADPDIAAALACFERHLAPGGWLTFESRNPLAEGWRAWTREQSMMTLEHPHLGPVEAYWTGQPSAEPEIIDAVAHYHFTRTGNRKISRSRLRFAPQATLSRLLTEAGFGHQVWYGDWDRSPVGLRSPELIVEVRRAGGR